MSGYKIIKGKANRHQSSRMITDNWLTPPEIIKALGPFDLDPCSPENRPWPTARRHFTINDNGLIQVWEGRVWLNPPYGNQMYLWMNKLAQHGNGFGLIFARTETKGFQSHIFPFVDSILFVAGRIQFYNIDGTLSPGTWAPAPSVLCAYGLNNVERLGDSGIKGKHVLVNVATVITITASPSWKNVVSIAITRLNGSAHLQEIYELVERIAPDKIQKNPHFKEKIRQTLQIHFQKVKRGHYTTSTTEICD